MTIIHTPTPNLDKSLDFYRRLRFQVIEHPEHHIVSDGQCLILINADRFARAGLLLYRDSWQELTPRLERMTAVTSIDNGYLLADPSGVMVYLMKGTPPVVPDLEQIQASHLGNFAGLSLESTDLNRSTAFWETLGFSLTMGSADQGWIGLSNEDQFTISLMRPNSCPHLFFNPSMTYFNGKNNLAVIEKVREAGIPITEEITHFNKEGLVDNIIIRDPGGYGFFLFND